MSQGFSITRFIVRRRGGYIFSQILGLVLAALAWSMHACMYASASKPHETNKLTSSNKIKETPRSASPESPNTLANTKMADRQRVRSFVRLFNFLLLALGPWGAVRSYQRMPRFFVCLWLACRKGRKDSVNLQNSSAAILPPLWTIHTWDWNYILWQITNWIRRTHSYLNRFPHGEFIIRKLVLDI